MNEVYVLQVYVLLGALNFMFGSGAGPAFRAASEESVCEQYYRG